MPEPASASDRLVAVGAGLFFVGLVAIVVTFGPFFFGHNDRPLWADLLSFLAPLGFGVALVGLLLQARETGGPGA